MSVALDALFTAYETEIATIGDTLLNAKATHTLDRWKKAVANQEKLENTHIDNYSIAGRTITRRNIGEGQDAIDRLEAEMQILIYGSIRGISLNTDHTTTCR